MYMCPKHDDFLFYARIVRAPAKRNFRHVDAKIFRRKMFTGSSISQILNVSPGRTGEGGISFLFSLYVSPINYLLCKMIMINVPRELFDLHENGM